MKRSKDFCHSYFWAYQGGPDGFFEAMLQEFVGMVWSDKIELPLNAGLDFFLTLISTLEEPNGK